MTNIYVDRFFKRTFDVAASTAGLFVLMPLLGFCAVAVKLTSPGPVLFRQDRVGRYGKIFRIAKFRTMSWVQTPDHPHITVGSDPRILRLGKILRKWKLDELPQLWNVLVGDMSIVGPRPEVPKYVALYTPEERRIILSVRPGITDPSSIRMRDESTILAGQANPERYYVETILPAKVRISREYIASRTVVSDLGLILKTMVAIFRSSPV